MFKLQKLNIQVLTDSEFKKAQLIADGFKEVAEPEPAKEPEKPAKGK